MPELLSSVRVTRETEPEAIDKLQRRKLELEVEIHALEREKDTASKERLQVARKAIAEVEEQLRPLKAAYENEKERGNEINGVRKKMDELKAKAEEAERRYVSPIYSLDRHMLNFFLDMTLEPLPISVTMPYQTFKFGSSSSRQRKLRRMLQATEGWTPSHQIRSRRLLQNGRIFLSLAS
jgi:hypothetical protein